MPSSNPAQRFEDILDNIARIERFTAGLHVESFIHDEEKLFAVQHALLIISEAATNSENLPRNSALKLIGVTSAALETACGMNTTALTQCASGAWLSGIYLY